MKAVSSNTLSNHDDQNRSPRSDSALFFGLAPFFGQGAIVGNAQVSIELPVPGGCSGRTQCGSVAGGIFEQKKSGAISTGYAAHRGPLLITSAGLKARLLELQPFDISRREARGFRPVGCSCFGASLWTAIKRNVSYGRHIGHLSAYKFFSMELAVPISTQTCHL